MLRSATGHRHRRWSLRHPGQPHQPPRSWPDDQSCTNIQPGPPSGGRPRPGPFDPSPVPPGVKAARPIFPLVAALGWAGDGSPGDGSLRNFAVGAVVQHFPRTLNRVEGKDFRLPAGDELDAMEAFQLSLGRQVEMNLNPNDAGSLRFADASVAQGQDLFFNGAPSKGNGGMATRTCSGCHVEAGAGTPNRNRATGAERSPLAP